MNNLQRSRQLLSGSPRRAARAIGCAWGFFVCFAGTTAHAQYTGAPSVSADDRALLAQMARDWLAPALESTLADNPDSLLRPEVIMGALDSRLRLAPCQQIEPFLPPGTRLWGRSRVGLRCLEGRVHWKVYVPVTVKAWGPAWVLRRAVPGGTVLTQDDADVAEMDWAEHTSPVLAKPESWIGQEAVFALQPGQTLRANMVRPIPAFERGAQVRVKSLGAGFHVVVSGQAMEDGVEGQAVRVKLTGGRMVTGTVRPGQVVEVKL
jgi:flagellar basal body P-ring formation protein FlgA